MNEKESQRINEARQIAQTILAQISASDPAALLAWGMEKPEAIRDFKAPDTGMYYLGGVAFRVNGAKVGIAVVTVLLNGRDMYDITITLPLHNGPVKIKSFTDVYCDQLEELIDGAIERNRQ